MKTDHGARNTIANILAILGAVLLVFAVLWWTLAVKRLVRYPSGVDLSVVSVVSVERLAGTHGLLKYDPPQKADAERETTLTSIDDRYTSSTAVVTESVRREAGGLPGGFDLDKENTFVIDRGDCINKKSPLSKSSGTVVDRSGSWSVNFPLGTDKSSYNLFNEDAASSLAVNYSGETTVSGVKAYLFEGSFRYRPLVDYRVRAMGLPAFTTYGDIKKELAEAGIPIDEMIRSASASLTARERETINAFPDDLEVGLDYTVKYRWKAAVEPVTGTVLNVLTDETRIFVNADVKTFLPLFEVLAAHAEDPVVERYLSQIDQQELLEPKEIYRVGGRYSRRSVADMAGYASGKTGRIRFVRGYMTYLFIILGAVLVVAGLVLRRERHHNGPHRRPGDGVGSLLRERGDAGAP